MISRLLVLVLVLVLVAVLTGCGDDAPAAPARPNEPPYVEAARAAIAPAAPSAGGVRLADATPGSGLDAFKHETGAFGKKYMPETMGPGVALADVNGDGRLDVVVSNGDFFPGHEPKDRHWPVPALFLNRGGLKFEDATAAAGFATVHFYGMGVAAADLEGDGDTDLLFGALDGVRILENDGKARFRDVTAESGAGAAVSGWVSSLALLDADRDGRLDVLCCRYVEWSPAKDLFRTIDGVHKSYATPQGYTGLGPKLLKNASEGGRLAFVDATAKAGIEAVPGKSLGAVVDDLDGDGVMDVAIANDTEPNALLEGRGDGTFALSALEAGIAYDEDGRARAGMGIDTTALARTGGADPTFAPAIAIANFSREPVSFYVAERPGKLFFRDLAGPAGIARPTFLTLGFGLRFVDLDLDGLEDLVVANGHIEPEVEAVERDVKYAEPLQVLRALGEDRYGLLRPEDAGAVLARPLVARGLATGDLDGDGDPDLVVTTNGGPLLLVRNDAAPARSLRVTLSDSRAPGNSAAAGAVVTVVAGSRAQRKTVKACSSYLSQGEIALTFGLGSHEGPVEVVVRWPDGAIQRQNVPAVDRSVNVSR